MTATERRLVRPASCRPLRIYVASSVRNQHFTEVVRALEVAGHDVYNFRKQPTFFPWSTVVRDVPRCSLEDQRQALLHDGAEKAFQADMGALLAADACVLVLPAGASSHLEAGFAVGAGKRVVILLAEKAEPELMNKMVTTICTSIEELVEVLAPRFSADEDARSVG